MDTTNDYAVGIIGDDIAILGFQRRLPKDKALRLAAWIVALTDDGEEQFKKQLEAILAT